MLWPHCLTYRQWYRFSSRQLTTKPPAASIYAAAHAAFAPNASTIFFNSGTHDPQLVPHLSCCCKPVSNASGLERCAFCTDNISAISLSATLKQLQITRPRGLNPCGGLDDGTSSIRPSAATGCSFCRYSYSQFSADMSPASATAASLPLSSKICRALPRRASSYRSTFAPSIPNRASMSCSIAASAAYSSAARNSTPVFSRPNKVLDA